MPGNPKSVSAGTSTTVSTLKKANTWIKKPFIDCSGLISKYTLKLKNPSTAVGICFRVAFVCLRLLCQCFLSVRSPRAREMLSSIDLHFRTYYVNPDHPVHLSLYWFQRRQLFHQILLAKLPALRHVRIYVEFISGRAECRWRGKSY